MDAPDYLGGLVIQDPRIAGADGAESILQQGAFRSEALGGIGNCNRRFFRGTRVQQLGLRPSSRHAHHRAMTLRSGRSSSTSSTTPSSTTRMGTSKQPLRHGDFGKRSAHRAAESQVPVARYSGHFMFGACAAVSSLGCMAAHRPGTGAARILTVASICFGRSDSSQRLGARSALNSTRSPRRLTTRWFCPACGGRSACG